MKKSELIEKLECIQGDYEVRVMIPSIEDEDGFCPTFEIVSIADEISDDQNIIALEIILDHEDI